MKNFDLEKRRYVLSAIASLIIVVYIIRLFSLQIASDDYRKSADSNAFLKKIEFPSRGTITDRNGKLLVYNQPAYDIMVVMNEEAGRLDTMDFCNALGITKEFFKKRMAEIKDRSKNPGYSRFTQQLFMGQLPDKEFSAFQEKIFRFPGFYIQRRSIRQYKEPLAAHLLVVRACKSCSAMPVGVSKDATRTDNLTKSHCLARISSLDWTRNCRSSESV